MTRADHPTGTDRVAEVAARLEQPASSSISKATSPRSPAPRSTASWHSSRTTPSARWPRSRPRSATSRFIATRPASRSSARARGRALYFSRSPIPHHRDGLPDPGRRRDRQSPTSTSASTPIAAISCSSSARFPLPRSRPPRSSSSSACWTPAIRSPSASSTSPASASIRPRITADSSRGGRPQHAIGRRWHSLSLSCLPPRHSL